MVAEQGEDGEKVQWPTKRAFSEPTDVKPAAVSISEAYTILQWKLYNMYCK